MPAKMLLLPLLLPTLPPSPPNQENLFTLQVGGNL
jgi:hypothetical protein